jgi:hypothetical protein
MQLASFGRRIRAVAVASAVTLMCGLWTHGASADNRVGEFVTNGPDWTYAPVITRSPNGAGGQVITVDNVLAVAKPGVANGDNLIAVWYVRESVGGTTWAAKTWEDTTWPGIAARLKNDLGLTDRQLEIFGQGASSGAMASAPSNYTSGFVEGDPMVQVVNDADPGTRQMLIEILKDTGYKIADPVFDEKGDCDTNTKLNEYSLLAVSVTSSASMSVKVSLLQAAYAQIETCLADVLDDSTTAVPEPAEIPGTFAPLPGGPDPWFYLNCSVDQTNNNDCVTYSRAAGTVKVRYWVVGKTTSCMFECTVLKFENITCCAPGLCQTFPSTPPCAGTGPGESIVIDTQNPVSACGFQLCP